MSFNGSYNGLGRNLGNLPWLSEAQTRSISAENPTGGKGLSGMDAPEPDGPARELGRGWKCRPYVVIADFFAMPGQHDICSVAYWYQTLPAQPLLALPDRNALEII